MASRRWVGSAVGVYRLLLEQQATTAGAAGRQLWQAELSLCLRPPGSSAAAAGSVASSTYAAQLHMAATLRAWLPAAASQAGGAGLRPRPRPPQQSQAQQAAGLHREDSVKSHLTPAPPLAGMHPWDSSHVPHRHAPQEHPRPVANHTYEAADAGGWVGAGWLGFCLLWGWLRSRGRSGDGACALGRSAGHGALSVRTAPAGRQHT